MLVSDGPKGPSPVGERVNIALVLEYYCHIKSPVYNLITEIYRFFSLYFCTKGPVSGASRQRTIQPHRSLITISNTYTVHTSTDKHFFFLSVNHSTSCLVSVEEFLQKPIAVPNEVDNLVFKGKLQGTSV
jgi:hypothetical protein